MFSFTSVFHPILEMLPCSGRKQNDTQRRKMLKKKCYLSRISIESMNARETKSHLYLPI